MKLFGNTGHRSQNNGNTAKKRKVAPDARPIEELYSDSDLDGGLDVESSFAKKPEKKKAPVPADNKEQYKTKKKKLTGLQKGLIILAAVIVFLVVLVTILWKSFAVLPDIATPMPITSAAPAESGAIQSIEVSAVPTNDPDVKVSTTSIIQVGTGGSTLGELLSVPGDRKEGWYTVLLVGTDKSEYLTDTLMLCSFDINNHKLRIVSIPRDTFIDDKDSTYKMNSAFTAGYRDNKSIDEGMQSLMEQVSLLVGFTPDAYCMINLESFVDIIDVVGGIDFDVPQDMYYSDPMQDLLIDLKAGYQHLDGEHCMELVRFRKGYASQDIQRMSVQQDFLKAVANKMLSIGTVSKIPELAQIVFDNLYTNLSLGNIVAFAEQLLKVKANEIETTTLIGEPGAMNGVSYYFLYGYDNLDIINDYVNPYDTDLTIDDIYIYTLESGAITRSLRSTTTNNHAYSNY